jgi:predicted outer membrane repeat protein
LHSATINIPADYATIQAGIDASTNADTVLVQPGTYVENISYNGKRIILGSLFLTTLDTTYISSTIIDGNAGGRVVTFENGEDSTTVLCGFTITNGLADHGGGIYCNNGASPSLEHLMITGNTANSYGGGIYCSNVCNPSLKNITISGNIADYGGGISCASSSPNLKNVEITGNNASYYGGAINCESSNLVLESVTISDNIAGNGGGGIYCGGTPSLINSIMWNNSPQEIDLGSGSILVTYSDIQGGWTGTGNIDSDPLFVDATNGDYHLTENSPCIDAGDPTSPLDPDNSIVEMGAYHFNQYDGPIWHISKTGSDVTGIGSEELPFATIQHGINLSADTDTVLVHSGTYVENISFSGKLITLSSLFLTTQDLSYISSTIIDGNNSDRVVAFSNNEDSTTVLCGFSIVNGSFPNGAGIYCNGASPVLNNLIVKNNSASSGGGGIACINFSDPTIHNAIIFDNSSPVGAGIYCDESSPNLQNVTITDNLGHGIYCNWDSTPTLINSILWYNASEEIFINSGSVTVTYSDVEGGWTGIGNIDSDPLFVDFVNGDYHLQPNSPCVDAGDPTSLLDPDNTVADMGAYYYHHLRSIWHISISGSDVTGDGSEPSPFKTIQLGIDLSADTDTVLVRHGTYVENIRYYGKLITVGSLFLTTNNTGYIPATIIDGNASSRVVSFLNGENSSAILTGFTITNGSTTYGGGIYCNGASPSLEYLMITGNTTTIGGGGVSCYNCSPTFKNVAIVDNIANNQGGGIYCHTNCVPSLENVTISSNTASSGGGIYCNNSNPLLINSILWNDSPQEIYIASGSVTATYSDIQGGYTGTGNIDSDPLFVDPANGDYHLQSSSPCIDAGDPSSPLDPDGTIVEMGAYYHQYNGPVWHISTTGSDITGNGSEELPFASIQLGIDFADSTNTVLVQPGTYVENINFNGKSITVGSLYLTTQDTTYISSTIIDGDSIASVVTFESGEDLSAVLCGFTITNGLGGMYEYPDMYGGGVTCEDSSPSLENLIITENTTPMGGGGIYCIMSSPNLENVIISENSAGGAGGIYCSSSSLSLNNVIISGNSTDGGGGGIYCSSSSLSLNNVIISGNSAAYGGGMLNGGMDASVSTLSTENVIISGNSATDGGGICFMGDAITLNIKDIIISGNSASGKGGGIFYGVFSSLFPPNITLNNFTISGNYATYGGGIYCYMDSRVVLGNCILWNDSPEEIYLEDEYEPNLITISYSDIQGGEYGIVVNNGMVQWQAGNINQDPLFVDPENGDYHLSWANFPIQDETKSPCIDTGNPGSALDPDDTRADMGACFFPQYLTAEFQADLTSGIVPFTVNFTDNSFLVTGVVDEWYWNFGDGESSTVQNPTHIYNDLGYHTVTLTVTGDNDSTDTEIKTDYIAVSANEQPAAPANVNINIIGNDVELNWNEVNTSIFGNFILTDYYLVYNSASPNSNYSFLGLTTDTYYTHQHIAQFSDKNFYQVSSYVGELRLLQSVIIENPNFKLGELDLLIKEKRIRINKSSGNLNRN